MSREGREESNRDLEGGALYGGERGGSESELNSFCGEGGSELKWKNSNGAFS